MSLRAAASGLVIALAVVAAIVAVGGCKKKDAPAKEEAAQPQPGQPAQPAPAPKAGEPAEAAGGRIAPAATTDGVRKVPIEVVEAGYLPDRIPGKPGEKLSLVFTRKADGHCYEELKTPDGKKIALPKNEPVEVAVTVPQEGEVKFACGMDMLTGVVVAEK